MNERNKKTQDNVIREKKPYVLVSSNISLYNIVF